MRKVAFFDRMIIKRFLDILAIFATICSLVLICVDIPESKKTTFGIAMAVVLGIIYFCIFAWANKLKQIEVEIEGSTVIVKEGDIFLEEGFKAIPFNEYFDTIVDDNIISAKSLNGIFINNYFSNSVEPLDKHISQYRFSDEETLGPNNNRLSGKILKYNPGTICVYDDYLITAFAKFDEKNRACLTMPEYLGFLNTFWDNVNAVYSQKCVSVPVFGSGITRIKEHRNIEDEDLLKIMLWTFKISETRFKYPAKLTIIIHKSKMVKINLFDILSAKNGF